MNKFAIIMAGGKGTRMKSEVPKVLHKILEEPMVKLVVQSLKEAGAERIVTVVGYRHELVENVLEGMSEVAVQEPQLGTGHAAMQARQLAGEKGITVVACGDTPLVRPETYAKMYAALGDAHMAVLTVEPDDPASYGRIVRNETGEVEKIVEFRDASEEERKIREINSGIYAFDNETLFEGFKLLKNDNSQHEYYITDLVEIFKGLGKKVIAVKSDDWREVQGINDNVALAEAAATLKHRINTGLMKQGVTIIDPNNTYIGPYVTFGHDVVVHPNTYLFGHQHIDDETEIMPGTWKKG